MRADGRTGGRAVGWSALLLAVLATQASNGPPVRASDPPTAQSRLWRPEERALVTDFSQVDAVAASPFTVYGATRHGLLIYDRRLRAWRVPVTTLDGYPAARVRVALADPADDGVWLGTDDGCVRYSLATRRWEPAVVAGGVSDLMLDTRDPASGIYVRSPRGWAFIPRGFGGASEPPGTARIPPPDRQLRPLTPEAALAQAPVAEALRPLVLLDPRLRLHQFTSVARSADQAELFFGTTGLGLVRVDPTSGEWEPLAFGLAGPHATALAVGVGGVWVANTALSGERTGVTWVADDFSVATSGDAATGAARAGSALLYVTARDLLAAGGALWLATERGLLRLDREGAVQRAFALDEVLSVAPAADGVWVGTTRGLVVVTRRDEVVRLPDVAAPILSLLAVRESLWVGTTEGLGLLAPGVSRLVQPPGLAEEQALRVPIRALARARDSIVAATDDQLAWRDPATGRWTLTRPDPALGRLTALAGDVQGGVWVGGTGGLAYWGLGAAPLVPLRVPGDVPAPVRDLAVGDGYLWAATDSGLVRFERAAALGGAR